MYSTRLAVGLLFITMFYNYRQYPSLILLTLMEKRALDYLCSPLVSNYFSQPTSLNRYSVMSDSATYFKQTQIEILSNLHPTRHFFEDSISVPSTEIFSKGKTN